jgi:phosphohistidine phosphatase
MKLWVIRHAKAGHDAPSDAERPLSAEGIARFTLHVAALERMGVRFQRVLHSPWRRAVETTRMLDPVLDGDTFPCEGLTREPDSALLDAIMGDPYGGDEECVAVVGHEPWLTELVGLLALGHREAGRAFELKKGGVVVLEGSPAPGGMRIRAHLPPRVLRLLR